MVAHICGIALYMHAPVQCGIAIDNVPSLTISDTFTALSLTHFIEWNDCEDILVTGTGVVRSEGVVCLSGII